MDNASKALIIAGAVLIAVMLVSIGVLVYQSSVGQIQTGLAQSDATNAKIYNSNYDFYKGAGKSRSTIISMLENIYADYNSSNDHTIEVTYGSTIANTAAGVKTLMGTVGAETNKTYKVEFTKDNSGYYYQCTITATSGTGS